MGSPLAQFMAGGPIGLEEIRGAGGLGATLEGHLLDSDRNAIPVQIGSAPLEVDGDQITCLTFTDLSALKERDREIDRLSQIQAERMTDLQAAQAALTEQATHDALTGLPNRVLLDRINQALSQSHRSRRCTAVLFVDLDRFKQVNDSYGHAAGDALRRVADTVAAALRPMDTVARIGGDEFIVLAPDLENHLQAVDLSNRLLAALSRRPNQAESGEGVAASIGISVSMGGRGTAEILLNEADTAMYRAKSLGGGRAEIFDGTLGLQLRQRSFARNMLQTALDDHRIVVHYQPIIDLTTGSAAGYEALARIAERDGTIVPPASFISVAESSGLVVPLGVQVLTAACLEAHRWESLEPPERRLNVAVNLSARQFTPGDLTTIVRETLERTGLTPACLHLELTETAIMELRPSVLQQLAHLRDLGLQIGLDDFGTGYSSLTHLRRLPLNFVKIDQSFVPGVAANREDERIVSAVIDLATHLGLRSIAEGVETTVQLDRLKELGCDQAQGYLFARPLPPSELPSTLGRPAL